jgi:hypothetical protein
LRPSRLLSRTHSAPPSPSRRFDRRRGVGPVFCCYWLDAQRANHLHRVLSVGPGVTLPQARQEKMQKIVEAQGEAKSIELVGQVCVSACAAALNGVCRPSRRTLVSSTCAALMLRVRSQTRHVPPVCALLSSHGWADFAVQQQGVPRCTQSHARRHGQPH